MHATNYFAHATAAQRYARARPFFHPLVIERIRASCGLPRSVDRALDVGCGTGQSTVALCDLAERVVGVDISAQMLSQVMNHPRASYLRASADRLPLANQAFEVLTVALAFHWLDRARFMREASRVLRNQGLLVIYNDGFSGSMNGNPDYQRWNRKAYLVRYPTPPRRTEPLSDDEAACYGFAAAGHHKFAHDVAFSRQQLVSYLLTQSNTISAIEQGRERVEEVGRWLMENIHPMFQGREERTFPFWCDVRIWRRCDPGPAPEPDDSACDVHRSSMTI